jgi:ABC-type glycerol-3-phosphate transport system substrate-binding protein
MPFPTQVNGKFCAVSAHDFDQAVSSHSKNKPAARAWLDWFTDKSGYAQSQGSIPTLKSGPMPDTLVDYTRLGVQYIELDQNQTALVNKIDNAAEVGLAKPDYRQHLVDVARGAASGSIDNVFADLNKKWSAGIKSAGG